MKTKQKAQLLSNFYGELANNDNGFTFANPNCLGVSQGPHLQSILKCFTVNPPKPSTYL